MGWIVRPAVKTDEHEVLEAIRSLCAELREKPDVKLPASASDVFQRIINNTITGAVFIAETTEGNLVGCATVSVQEVIFRGGPYALIQELWVHPSYRSLSVGAALVRSVEGYCRKHSLKRLEVCLPDESFVTFDKTLKFYGRVGFAENGPYMAKVVF
ncbi:GNAT family N-acetyltransferase [Paenibacillus sp. PR3]|uniref:GNAT family N-acetyltransferase n=1 Tax=Paenibacillus terricola TaxID=2763503 RepID=A0ABR8N0I4_9BACL|nr:GNAT family N-acetyltransferase [Paenibacillus terricola]MBD3921698.1 GNAT family N-acetyltransferase [Paenibacillus terricola]